MKLQYNEGKVSAVAENIADMQQLIARYGEKAPETKTIRKAKRASSWKGKHKKECATCKGMFRNVKLHAKIAHEGLMVGMNARKHNEAVAQA